MATTYLKRQKEMKRLDKQRAKAERRAQKKLASRAPTEPPAIDTSAAEREALGANGATPSESKPHD
jgi:hypothetical protein